MYTLPRGHGFENRLFHNAAVENFQFYIGLDLDFTSDVSFSNERSYSEKLQWFDWQESGERPTISLDYFNIRKSKFTVRNPSEKMISRNTWDIFQRSGRNGFNFEPISQASFQNHPDL